VHPGQAGEAIEDTRLVQIGDLADLTGREIAA